MLQPSLSGNARISVVCTINPDASAISETMSTLLFAKRVGGVKVRFNTFCHIRSTPLCFSGVVPPSCLRFVMDRDVVSPLVVQALTTSLLYLLR